MGKYEGLTQFLSQSDRSHHRMSFGEIERVLQFKLPKSAYQHEAWWSNNATGHSHARAWLSRGWRSEAIDLTSRKVTFRRVTPERAEDSSGRGDPWGCMAGTVTILPATDLTAPSDEKWNAEEGRLLNE